MKRGKLTKNDGKALINRDTCFASHSPDRP